MSDESRLVVLTHIYAPQNAHVVRGYLESHGIPCFLYDEHTHNVAWHLQVGIGGVRVMVPAAFHQDAAELLLENELVNASDIKPLLPQDTEGLLKSSFALLVSLLTGAPFVWRKRKTFEDTEAIEDDISR